MKMVKGAMAGRKVKKIAVERGVQGYKRRRGGPGGPGARFAVGRTHEYGCLGTDAGDQWPADIPAWPHGRALMSNQGIFGSGILWGRALFEDNAHKCHASSRVQDIKIIFYLPY